MVRRKEGGLAQKDGAKGRMFPKFLVKEGPDSASPPAVGVDEIGVEGQTSMVERPQFQGPCLGTVDGQVEDGDVEKIDEVGKASHELEGSSR